MHDYSVSSVISEILQSETSDFINLKTSTSLIILLNGLKLSRKLTMTDAISYSKSAF